MSASAFVGPLVPHHSPPPVGYASMTGGLSEGCFQAPGLMRDDLFNCDDLDAPEHLASGGSRLMVFPRFSMSAHTVMRPGSYS